MLKINKTEKSGPHKIVTVTQFMNENIITISDGKTNAKINMKVIYDNIDGENHLSSVSFNDGENEINSNKEEGFVPVFDYDYDNKINNALVMIVSKEFPEALPEEVNKIADSIQHSLNSILDREIIKI